MWSKKSLYIYIYIYIYFQKFTKINLKSLDKISCHCVWENKKGRFGESEKMVILIFSDSLP